MARPQRRYVCQECGAVYTRWQGQCDACQAWNTIVEEVAEAPAGRRGLTPGSAGGRPLPLTDLAGTSTPPPRLPTGIGELDRVTGGGLVAGSALLIGGDPGIGKSTLLLQAAATVAAEVPAIYISGEEAVDQVRLRARRLGLAEAPVQVAAATSVRDIAATIEAADRPGLVVIDSIQTMVLDTVESAPGTVAQVRACGHELIRLAKRLGCCLFLVGHVTKDGAIAGPRVLEHMVDAVLYFEGERGHQFRILRAVKNRFGATDEIGVFEMADDGLRGVANPSALFLAERRGNVSGSCVFAGLEGSRPVLVEVQALVAPAAGGVPRRAVVGWDGNRLAMVLAVLEARCRVALAGRDVYLNVAGGLKLSEPAADLAVSVALISSLTGVPAPADAVVFGEIGLSGEIRAVAQADLRLKEAAKLGFVRALVPARHGRGRPGPAGAGVAGVVPVPVGHVQDVVDRFGVDQTG